MLSSQLALYGLEALEEGNPYIAAFISQKTIIEKFSSIPRFKEIWDRAISIAKQLIPEDKQGVVHVQLVFACFLSNTVQIIGDDFDLSIINSHAILHSKSSRINSDGTSTSLIRAEVNIILFA